MISQNLKHHALCVFIKRFLFVCVCVLAVDSSKDTNILLSHSRTRTRFHTREVSEVSQFLRREQATDALIASDHQMSPSSEC